MLTEKEEAFGIVFVMILLITLPAAIVLNTVIHAGSRQIPPNPSPYGYTLSLLLFIIPVITIAWWFLAHPKCAFQKKAFWRTIALLTPLGVVLDVLFGNVFFQFSNPDAVLGITFPAIGGQLPIEELIFYITGFTVVLLSYIWADEYWLAAYNIPDYEAEAGTIGPALKFHGKSALVGIVLLALAVLYKNVFADPPGGVPWYFVYLTVAGLVPGIGLFLAVERFINWRAFAFTLFWILLVSLLWEATLALPYGWWGYREEAMMGIFVGAWSRLPLEAVLVWLAVTFTTVVVFESVKIWIASHRPLKDFLTAPQKHASADAG